MSMPSYLTFFRILLGPIFFFLYTEHEKIGITPIYLPFILLFILLISELTDAFDGFLARKLNQVTDLGKLLDPMADSLSRITIFLAFTKPPVNLYLGLILIFLYRDMFIGLLRTMCALKGFALAARKSGKAKAVFQALGAFIILFLIILYHFDYLTDQQLTLYSNILVFSIGIYTIFTGIEYIYANRSYLKKVNS